MKHENRGNILILTFFWVISCTQIGYSQHFNNDSITFKPILIETVKAYRATIADNNSKRMVLLKNYVQPCFTFLKYADTNNFTHQQLYTNPEAFTRLPVALALQKVQNELLKKGLSLGFFDAYRPWSVTYRMWTIVPDERYAANPTHGSDHNRGLAIDVTLTNLKGTPLPMPTEFDDFSQKAHHNYMKLSMQVLKNRKLLRSTMEKFGFRALQTEWWHYSFRNGEKFEILDLDFETLLHECKTK